MIGIRGHEFRMERRKGMVSNHSNSWGLSADLQTIASGRVNSTGFLRFEQSIKIANNIGLKNHLFHPIFCEKFSEKILINFTWVKFQHFLAELRKITPPSLSSPSLSSSPFPSPLPLPHFSPLPFAGVK